VELPAYKKEKKAGQCLIAATGTKTKANIAPVIICKFREKPKS